METTAAAGATAPSGDRFATGWAGWAIDVALALVVVGLAGAWLLRLGRLNDPVTLAGAPHGPLAVATGVVALALLGAGLAVRRHRPLTMLALGVGVAVLDQWALNALLVQAVVWPLIVYGVARFTPGRRARLALLAAAVGAVAPPLREPWELVRQSWTTLAVAVVVQTLGWWVCALTPYAIGRMVRSRAIRRTAARGTPRGVDVAPTLGGND